MMSNWIKRKNTKVVSVGNVKVGGTNPISVQSMTNTNTSDVISTVKQINDLENSLFLILKIFSTATSDNASQPIPQIVSVGYKIVPSNFKTFTALIISLFNF